jgi:hypothetical protein
LEKRLNERAETLSSQSAMTIGISFYGKSNQRNFDVFNSVKRRATLVDAMIGTGRGIKPTMAAHQP